MTEKERYETAIKGLDQTIHHLTWLGNFWGLKGVLVLDIIRYRYIELIGGKRNILSARSSLCYSAAGNAGARASKKLKLFWLIVGYLCLKRADYFSDCFAKIGLGNMTVGELDIRSSIKRKMKKWVVAMDCINEALNREKVASHSKVLLMVGKADILAIQGVADDAYALYEETMRYAQSSLLCLNSPDTYVRLLKSYARFLIEYRRTQVYPKALDLLKEAKEIAKGNGLKDQVEKIEALEKQIN